MAQNKRFLGLGFTFNATDKGLEKKLTNVRNLFRDINKLSGNVGKNSGKIKLDGPGLSGGSGERKNRFLKPKKSKDSIKSVSKNYDDVIKVATSYTEALGKDVGAAYKMEAAKVIDESIKKGRSADFIIGKLKENAEGFAKSAKLLNKEFQAISRISQYLKKWSNDVINKFEDFLGAVGVNLRDMIPKEVVAAFGVVGAIMRPLKDLFSNLSGKAFGGAESKNQQKLISRVNSVLDSIGDNKSLDTPQESLSNLVEILGKKDKGPKGAISKLQALPFIGPIIDILSKFGSLITWTVGLLLGFGKQLVTLGKWLRFLYADASIFSTFTEGLSSVGRFFGRFGGIVVALGVVLFGFIKEIVNWKDSFISMFDGLSSLFGAVSEYVSTFFKVKIFPIFESSFGMISGILTPTIQNVSAAFQMLLSPLKLIFDILLMFGKNIAKVTGGLWDIAGSLSKSFATDVKTATQEMKMQNKVVSPQGTTSGGLMNNLASQKASAENTGMLVDLAKKQNDLMNSLLETMDHKNIQGPNAVKHEVFIKTNPKEISAQVRRQEVNYATVTGNDQ